MGIALGVFCNDARTMKDTLAVETMSGWACAAKAKGYVGSSHSLHADCALVDQLRDNVTSMWELCCLCCETACLV